MLTPDENGRLRYPEAVPLEVSYRGADLSVAQWVFDHAQLAGLGTDTLPAAPAIYLPLRGPQRSLGVLAVLPVNRRRVLLPEQRRLLETFAGQIALAWERTALGEEAATSRVAAETETLRNTLLASISHDLRTPLAVITGAASTLARTRTTMDPAAAVARRSIESRRWRCRADLERARPDAARVGPRGTALRHAHDRGPCRHGAASTRATPAGPSGRDRPAGRFARRSGSILLARRCYPTCSRTPTSTRRRARRSAWRPSWTATWCASCRRRRSGAARGRPASGCSTNSSADMTKVPWSVPASGSRSAARSSSARWRNRGGRARAAVRGSSSRCRWRSGSMTEAMHQILVVEDDPASAPCCACYSRRKTIVSSKLARPSAAKSRRARTSRTCCSSTSACRTRTDSR